MKRYELITALTMAASAIASPLFAQGSTDTTSATPAANTTAAAPDTRPTVAVMYFTNGALGKAHEDLDPLSKGIADMLITDMQGNSAIRVIERDQLQHLLEEQNLSNSDRVDRETAVQVGKLLGVHHMIFGGFVTDLKGNMRLDARAVNVETGEIEHVETVSNKQDNLMAMIDDLARKMNAGMKLPQMASAAAQASADHAKKVPFQSVMLYSRALAAKDKGDTDTAVQLFRAALEKFPDYDAAQTELRKLESQKAGE